MAPNSPRLRANAEANPRRWRTEAPGTPPGETSSTTGAKDSRRLLLGEVELEEHGLHAAHDQRQRHEEQREQFPAGRR
jgi:hypothetical protein